jgi:hypothetical protein
MALQRNNQAWAPKPNKHLEKAKERALTHDVDCFDHNTSKYQVTKRGGTKSDGEVRPLWSYIVVLCNFSCRYGKTRQYHFPCSHYVATSQHWLWDLDTARVNVDSLVLTWSPCFEPYLDEGHWPPYTGSKYIADPVTCWDKHGTRNRTRHKMVMVQVSGRTRWGRATPFLTDPEQNQCGKCVRLGLNSCTCHWPLSQVKIINVREACLLVSKS